MKNRHIIIVITLLFTSCLESKVNEEDDHRHGAHTEHYEHGQDNHGHDAHTEEVHLKKEQFDLMGIELGSLSEQNISSSIQANGTLELPPQNKASLSAIAEGRVKSILVTEGVAIKKGQTIATIENLSFIQLQKEYLTLKRKNKQLEQDYNRKNKLKEGSIISQKDFDVAFELYENNLIELKTTKAQLNLLGISINNLENGSISTSIPIQSPISGFVRLINITMNSYVHTGDVLFEILDNEHMHIDLMVFEKDIPFIKKDQRVTFSMAGTPNKIYEASVFAVGKALETELRAMRVHAELKEDDPSVLPGMFVNATIYANNFVKLALFEDAFIEEEGNFYVFVKSLKSNNEEFVFEKVKVVTGDGFNGFRTVAVSKQFKEDSEVVVKGAFYLNAEMSKEEFEHSH